MDKKLSPTKILAAVLFIMLPFIAFFVGYVLAVNNPEIFGVFRTSVNKKVVIENNDTDTAVIEPTTDTDTVATVSKRLEVKGGYFLIPNGWSGYSRIGFEDSSNEFALDPQGVAIYEATEKRAGVIQGNVVVSNPNVALDTYNTTTLVPESDDEDDFGTYKKEIIKIGDYDTYVYHIQTMFGKYVEYSFVNVNDNGKAYYYRFSVNLEEYEMYKTELENCVSGFMEK